MDRIIGGIIVALLFCGIGFLFARIGYCFFRDRNRQKRRCLARTRGTIVGIQRMPIKTSRRRRMCYFPVYEYTVNARSCGWNCNLAPHVVSITSAMG